MKPCAFATLLRFALRGLLFLCCLIAEMKASGCTPCHGGSDVKQIVFEDDWFNLQTPEFSKILRAPLPKDSDAYGLGLCRERGAMAQQRIRLLVEGYAHAVKPIDQFPHRKIEPRDARSEPIVMFESSQNAVYQRMLAIIRTGREMALRSPRINMPGAKVIPGECRGPAEPQLTAIPK